MGRMRRIDTARESGPDWPLARMAEALDRIEHRKEGIGARTWLRPRRRLADALTSSGFTVTEHRTWL
jgi:hypothetical protein